MRYPLLFALTLALATRASAQDSTARGNPLAKTAVSKDGNPLAKPAGEAGNPLARDEWVGTWTGQSLVGPVTIEIRKEADGYAVVDKSSQRPMNGTAKLDSDGALKGEYVVKLLGMTRRHKIDLRPEEGGLRYRTTALNIVVRKQ